MTPAQLATATGSTQAAAVAWLDPIAAAMEEFDISTGLERAGFLAQCGHESKGLTALRENMNYTPNAIRATFNTRRQRFTWEEAERYGRTKEHKADLVMIASIAYENRMGNGPRATTDGWLYRGGGIIHNTGRRQYAVLGDRLGVDLEAQPELIAQPLIAARAAALFWHINNLSDLLDENNIDAVSMAVNGGTNGLHERRVLFAQAKEVFA